MKTINWGFWGDVGVVAKEAYRRLFAANGVGSISTQEGMEAIARVLACDVDQVFAMKVDEGRRAAFGVDDGGGARTLSAPAIAESHPREPAEAPRSRLEHEEPVASVGGDASSRAREAPPAGGRERTEARIVRCVADAIHLRPEDVDRTKQFSDYGVDSIVGVKLVNAISDEFGLVLRTTILFDYPSVEELARYLDSQEKSKPRTQRAVGAAPQAEANGSSELSLLKQLASGELSVDQVYSRWKRP